MNGKSALMENLVCDLAAINSTSSSLRSPSYSMKGFHRAAVLIGVGAMTATGETINVSILGGDSTTAPASMSSLTNATLAIGSSSTKGTIINADKVRVSINGTIASALTLQVGTSTFISDSTASSTGKAFISGGSSAVAKSLTTMIQTYYPDVNATYSNTGATVAYVDIERQNQSSSLKVVSSAQATADGFTVLSQLTKGMICFDAGDLTATASSFTNFSVLVNCTGSSAIPIAITVIREGVHARDKAIGWGPKTDMSTSALI